MAYTFKAKWRNFKMISSKWWYLPHAINPSWGAMSFTRYFIDRKSKKYYKSTERTSWSYYWKNKRTLSVLKNNKWFGL